MSFLAPLFLLGALAVGLPVIFHLIRRTSRERKAFSSLMFLLPTPPRLTRRSRLEHILLLLLRCTILGLLALGFARPFLKRPVVPEPASGAGRRVVILVDTSASMRRANLWAEARDKVQSVLRKTSPADQVALFAFDAAVNPLVTFEQWNAAPAGERAALVTRQLAALTPGWASTHLGNAVIRAAEVLADTTGSPQAAPRQIILISDFQEGSRLDQLQGYAWPKGIELTAEPVKPRHVSNAGIQLVTEAEDTNPKPADSVRVRVVNAPDSRRDQLTVRWAGRDGTNVPGQPVSLYVPPGQSRIVAVPVPAGGAPDRILLEGDEEDFDNTVFVIPPEAVRVKVLYLGADADGDPKQPLYFLRHALQQTRRQAIQVLSRRPEATLNADEVREAALYIVSDPLPEAQADSLREQVAHGRTLLFTVRTAAAAPTLARLLGVERLDVSEAQVRAYAMLAEIDFRHPLFAAFADPRFSDFTGIHFWKYRRLDAQAIPQARVVAAFDTGDPALLDVPVGQGRVLILTAGWHSDDSQFALSTKFVPFLYSLLEETGAAVPPPMQYHVAETIPLPPTGPANHASPVIVTPEGAQITLSAGETNFSKTLAPGIYSLASTQPPKRFAVNLDPAESRTAPLPGDELERLGAPISQAASAVAAQGLRSVRLQNAELESRQKFWRWLILAALAVLLAETWLAGRTSRRSSPELV